MNTLEAKVEDMAADTQLFGIQVDGPMQKDAVTGILEMKPMGFPQDARWYYSGLG
jgi:hypothetical protein